MVDMKTLIDLQVTIFCLMLAGYILTKLKILSPDARKPLSGLLINFILPCNIIVSFMIDFNRSILRDCIIVFIVSACIQLFAVIAGHFFYPRKDKGKLAVMKYGTLVSNAGFMGNPIAQGLYGSQGLLYASIYLIPQRIMMWSAGVTCFTGTRGKNVIKKICTHPCIIAVAIGLVIMIAEIRLPSGLDKTVNYASDCTTAISMIVIGNILAGADKREIISKENVWFCTVRLIIFPLIVLAGCMLTGINELVTNVSVVLAGMPAAATTAILAAQYDGDASFAAEIVFLSTLLSLITIPCLCLIMGYILIE